MKTQPKNKTGFTLIELLVVIAIIAMLLAILMPALGAVKKQAQRVVCMSNLSQWGLIFTLYTEDHDGHFFAGFYDYTDPNGVTHSSSDSDLWPYAMESYYQLPKLKFCPSSGFSRWGRSRTAWGNESDEIFSGSYGLNGWVCDTPEEVTETEGHDTANSWRTMDITNSGKIPLMADALWYTGRPESHDLPPEEQGQFGQENRPGHIDDSMMMMSEGMPGMGGADGMMGTPKTEPNGQMVPTMGMPGMPEPNSPMMEMPGFVNDPEPESAVYDWQGRHLNHMQRFTVDRHKEKTNVLMMDGMVKTISPKELWRLKWHKNYDASAPLPEWPEWMKDFKDPN